MSRDYGRLPRPREATPAAAPALAGNALVFLAYQSISVTGPDVHLARLFTHLTYDVGIRLLALLEAAPGTSAQGSAVRFLEALNLHGTPRTHVLPHG